MNREAPGAVGAGARADDDDAEPRGAVRVEYHVHTSSSYDSKLSPEAALDRALAANLDVLCVTDHDTIEGAVKLSAIRRPGLKVVVGCEFTTEDGSHVIGLNLRDMIPEKGLFAILEGIKRQDGLVLLPHPFRRGSGIFRNERRRPAGFLDDVLGYTDVVECFNARDTYENNQRSHGFALTHDLPAVAGSDAHRGNEIGSVFVEYLAADFVHGASPHRVWFPTQAPRKENRAKRALMELYHGNKERLPAFVTSAYLTVKRKLAAEAPGPARGPARMQYDFPVASDRGTRRR